MNAPNSFRNQPDERGHFGQFGGRYVAETLMPLILDLEREYRAAKADPAFQAEFDDLLEHYVGRPSPLYFAAAADRSIARRRPPGKGAQVWFKRDELNHTGAHKINNCVGQILLAMPHGQDADHRRDRRGPARRRHRHRRRALRPALRRSTWAPRTSSGSSPTCSA